MHSRMPFVPATPAFDWLQVEVSSYCNAACTYCPHTVYRAAWLNRHLPLTTFKRLLPYLKKTKLVYLQGWGEPLLHPDFFTLVSLAKQAGCRVGTTTNGMLVDAARAEQLVASGIDVVGFSLAGTDEKNDAVRRGTQLKNVLGAIQLLNQAKREVGAQRPAVHIAYMLLRSGIAGLNKLPDLLRGYGIREVVISALDFVPSPELAEEALFLDEGAELNALRALLRAVVDRGKKTGLNIYCQLAVAGHRKQFCSENVQRALFISANGLVSPCVFTNLPVTHAMLVVQGTTRQYRRLTFGNVNGQALSHIWRQKDYARFRHSFSTGHLAGSCLECPKLSLTSIE